MLDCVTILAGGGGTRLWPVSTKEKPKQLMNIGSSKSLLLQTLERAWELKPSFGVFIVCGSLYADSIEDEIAKLNDPSQRQRCYILPEPEMRNTAVALYYASQLIRSIVKPDASQLVLASDHLIHPIAEFKNSVGRALEQLANRKIVVFGLVPSQPATGYGYIEQAETLADSPQYPHIKATAVKRFTEKPNLQRATEFVQQGSFFWNSGMFVYNSEHFQSEMEHYSPEICKNFSGLEASYKAQLRQSGPCQQLVISPALQAAYSACPNISIDYALMEQSKDLALVVASFEWNDIGSWDVLAEVEEQLSQQCADGPSLPNFSGREIPVVAIGDSKNNYVRSSIPVALCNVSDLIVIESEGTLLICQRGESQQVKEASQKLQEQGG